VHSGHASFCIVYLAGLTFRLICASILPRCPIASDVCGKRGGKKERVRLLRCGAPMHSAAGQDCARYRFSGTCAWFTALPELLRLLLEGDFVLTPSVDVSDPLNPWCYLFSSGGCIVAALYSTVINTIASHDQPHS